MKKMRKPSHPGAFFKHTVLDERNISITSAAASLGVTRKALSEFVNGKAKCSHSMARRLADASKFRYLGSREYGFWYWDYSFRS